MSYKVVYHPDVVGEDILSVPKGDRDRIKKAIEERLMVDPVSYGDPLRKTLKGYRKLRVGDYRVIYKLSKNIVIVLKIGNRKEVYKKFDRGWV